MGVATAMKKLYDVRVKFTAGGVEYDLSDPESVASARARALQLRNELLTVKVRDHFTFNDVYAIITVPRTDVDYLLFFLPMLESAYATLLDARAW